MGKIFNKAKEPSDNEVTVDQEVSQESVQEAEASAQFEKELNKLNSIRDILFGENMQQYQKEFDEIKKIIQENQERTDSRISEMRSEIMDKISSMDENLNARINKTDETLSEKIADLKDSKADRKVLSSMFMDIARQLDS